MSATSHPRPLTDAQHEALRALVEVDRLPGQPALTRTALGEALAGRSPVDGGWWDELTDLQVDTLSGDDSGGELAGAVSWGYRARDDTAVLLWLHARENPEVTAELLDHVLARHRGSWTAFDFASALTLGVEALPVRHRPVTAAALDARGFTGSDLWRYMHRPLADLPPRPDLALTSPPAQRGGWELVTPDGAGRVEVTDPVGGVGLIGWLGVDEDARGRGLGAALLVAALWQLTEHGATDAVLYVDDDEPGTERDRRAANRLYDRTGFREVDRLHSYTRP